MFYILFMKKCNKINFCYSIGKFVINDFVMVLDLIGDINQDVLNGLFICNLLECLDYIYVNFKNDKFMLFRIFEFYCLDYKLIFINLKLQQYKFFV